MTDLQADLNLINKRIRHAKITREGLEAQLDILQGKILALTIDIANNEAKAKRLYSADVPK